MWCKEVCISRFSGVTNVSKALPLENFKSSPLALQEKTTPEKNTDCCMASSSPIMGSRWVPTSRMNTQSLFPASIRDANAVMNRYSRSSQLRGTLLKRTGLFLSTPYVSTFKVSDWPTSSSMTNAYPWECQRHVRPSKDLPAHWSSFWSLSKTSSTL